MSGASDPKEVRDLRVQLAKARRDARGVKESWRNLRAVPRSEQLTAVTQRDLDRYDSEHPAATVDETTRRFG